MKFSLFYEIPVADPGQPGAEYRAYQNTLEQAIFGEQMGFHAFWTVEHHFLKHFSHCSNPEVLYGAIASRTERIRLGYGVRLMPKPYNHPIRSAESAAVLDLLSGGRVDFGTGRSATRAELEGFGIHPDETREMWLEAIRHVVGAWTQEEYAMEGRYWQSPPRPVIPKPLQDPHPPLFGATSSLPSHEIVGEMGMGLCSFTVGLPPEELRERIETYRKGLARCTKPIGAFVNDQAATFTMVNCAPTDEESFAVSKESFEWYPKVAARMIATVAQWQEQDGFEIGNYDYTRDVLQTDRAGLLDELTFDYLKDSGSAIVGGPDRVVECCRRYQETGCDILLCLVNPYDIPHEKVMQTIELMGKYVIPEFS